jgi:hypothetical protein
MDSREANKLRSANWKNIAEFFGIAAIVISLVMVSYELRQNTAIAIAQAVYELNTVLDEGYRARAQDSDLNELIDKVHSESNTLSERERSQFHSWLRADMNATEAIWFYQDRGKIPQPDIDGYKAAICSRVITPGGKKYWESEAQFFAAGVRQAIDEWCF